MRARIAKSRAVFCESSACNSVIRTRIADLILYVGEFCCNQTDAKWLLFPFNKSCRFVIKNPLFLNIYFEVPSSVSSHPQNIRKLVSSPLHPTEALFFRHEPEAVSIPPLQSFPSSKLFPRVSLTSSFTLSLSVAIMSLCSVSAGSGRCVLLRVQSSNYTPTSGGLIEMVAIGTTLQLRVVSKGKEDSVDVRFSVEP